MLRVLALVALVALVLGASSSVRAEAPFGGLELALHGLAEATPGRTWRAVGQAFEVRGLARLRPLPRGELEAFFTSAVEGVSEGAHVRVGTDADGRFLLEVPVPAQAHGEGAIAILLRRGEHEREIQVPIQLSSAEQLLLRTDRRFYEPGEPIHVWALVRDRRSGRPLPGRRVRLASGLGHHEPREVQTDASGVAYARFELPTRDETAHAHASATLVDGSIAVAEQFPISVSRRVSERLLVALEGLDVEVSPAGSFHPTVHVTAPSGAPVVGAIVTLTVTGLDPLEATTDREGDARFEARVPAFLSTETGSVGVVAEVAHAAFGSARASGRVSLAVPMAMRLELVPESGALVPELPSGLFLRVTDTRGEPVSGSRVWVRGPGLAREVEVRTDANGLARVEVSVPAHAVAALHDGSCGDGRGAIFDVRVEGPRDRVARRCVAVHEAAVRARLEPPAVAPGEDLVVRVSRRPMARGWPVAVLLYDAGSELVGFSMLAPGQERARFEAPRVLGVVHAEARPLEPDGVTTLGLPFADAALVRPAAPSFPVLTPSATVFPVGGEATLRVSGAERGWIALDVRDLAQHGGERAFTSYFLAHRFARAVLDPSTPDAERLVRAALVGHVTQPAIDLAVSPRVDDFGRPRESAQDPAEWLLPLGDLRDPRPLGIELTRRGLDDAYRALEAALAEGAAPLEGEGPRRRFAEDALEQLGVDLEALGGEPATMAALLDADPSFTFVRAARRVARSRLVRVLVGLSAALDEGVLEEQPPERWLSTLVRAGRLNVEDLRDPWDHVLGLRARPERVPALAVELGGRAFAFPGPDGRLGTADDVVDPFVREVPQGSAYALASGEDELQRRLALLAPGPAALEDMLAAYDRITRAMLAAQLADAASADATQGLADGTLFEGHGGVGLGILGSGGGGGGSGHGYARGVGRSSRAPSIRNGSAAFSSMGSLRGLVRDELPATLRFVPSLALQAGGTEVRLPLADAATTYLVEAIHWREDGWIWSAQTQLRVDREVVVDAPVPSIATEGDELALPVRVRSRGVARTLRLGLMGEGGIAFDSLNAGELRVPADEAVVRFVRVGLARVGRGRIVVAAFEGDRARDALGRPLEVLPAGRLQRITIDSWLPRDATLELSIPEGATWRRAPIAQVSSGDAAFGGAGGGWAAWSARLRGVEVSEADLRVLREHLAYGQLSAALALGSLWTDRATTDEAALEAISRLTPSDGASPNELEALTLLALSPARRHAHVRPRVEAALGRLVDTLRDRLENEAALSSDRPAFHAAVAAALVWIGDPRAAREPERRAARHLARFGEETWLQAYSDATHSQNVAPTALLALARLGDQRPLEAFPLVRTLARWAVDASSRPSRRASLGGPATELAAATASFVARAPSASLTLSVGQAVHRVDLEEGRGAVALGALGEGRHTLRSSAGSEEGAVHVRIEGELRVPWRDERGPLELRWRRAEALDEPGDARASLRPVRDHQTELVLEVRNRTPRSLPGAVIEVQLPAGAELDAAALARLRAGARSAAIAGGVLHVQIGPLLPGRARRLPIALRWSVGGRLSALGTAGWPLDRPDATSVLSPLVLDVRPAEEP